MPAHVFRKRAELGGDGSDTQLESAFNTLAYSSLREKAHGLLNYELGFQLLDRNQEGDRAAGVFGFKIGPHEAYAPLFFLNGQIKGHELLWLKEPNQFVPLKENWVNYLVNRRPNVLGKSVDKNISRHGIDPPDLSSYKAPMFKGAIKLARWSTPAAARFLAARQLAPDQKAHVSLPAFLGEAGEPAIAKLAHWFLLCPKLAQTVEKMHGSNLLQDALTQAKKNNSYRMGLQVGQDGSTRRKRMRQTQTRVIDWPEEEKDPVKSGKLVIYRMTSVSIAQPVDEDKKQKLLDDGVLIEDHREETSKAYRTETTKALTNPTETGVYQVLVKPGEFTRCLVLLNPYSCTGPETFATVVRLEGEKAWLNIHPTQLWVQPLNDHRTEYRKLVEGLSSSTPSTSGRRQLLLGSNGQGTCPFTAYSEDSDDSYRVSFSDYAQQGRAGDLPPLREPKRRYSGGGDSISFTGKPGRNLEIVGNTLYIPDGFKVFKLQEDNDMCCGSSQRLPLIPAADLDLRHILREKFATLTVQKDGPDWSIGKEERLPWTEALIALVRDHGLKEAQARDILAETQETRHLECFVKYANPYPMTTGPGPSAPALPMPEYGSNPLGGQLPAQLPFEQYLPVNMPMEEQRQQYSPDAGLLQQLQRASQLGSKEVMDASLIGGLLRNTSEDSIVNRHIGPMQATLDSLGNMLLSFYWHPEEFEERFGKEDLLELEDSLRNNFEGLGDLVLFLKQKSVNAYDDAGFADLSSSSRM